MHVTVVALSAPAVSGKNDTSENGTSKNGTSKNGTSKNGKVGKHGTFSILGFRVGLGVWDGGLGLGMGF